MQAMTKEHSGFVPTFSAFPDGYAVPEQMRDSWKLSRRRAKNSSPLKSFFLCSDTEKKLCLGQNRQPFTRNRKKKDYLENSDLAEFSES